MHNGLRYKYGLLAVLNTSLVKKVCNKELLDLTSMPNK